MTREEAIAYLEKLMGSVDICYACSEGCMSFDECKLKAVIEWMKRPLGDRIIDVLREVRGE